MSQEVRQILTGPIPSIRTPFTSDGDVDYPALEKVVEQCISGGSKVLMLTAGDSHFIALTDQEIADVTRFVGSRIKGRPGVHMIAADRYYDTRRAVEFARMARGAGALCVMTLPPDWAGSTTAQSLAQHYATVARELPVMIVTNIFNPRGHAFGLETMDLALKASSNVVAVKDDTCGDFSRMLCDRFQDRLSILAGGLKSNHLAMLPFGGGHGYLSTFASLHPGVANTYWAAYTRGDIAKARRIHQEIDVPFFEVISGCKGSFDAGMHAAMEAVGLCTRHRRLPYHTLTDEEAQPVKDFMATVGGRLGKIGVELPAPQG